MDGAAKEAGAPDLVLVLGRRGRTDPDVAGGKGANLAELVRAGFPVPAGFVVTTAAYRPPDLGPLGTAGPAAIRGAVVRAGLPHDVADAVCVAYRNLGGAVAVRSSATAEDLPEAAFAGQQDTFLNVIGEQDVLDAVVRCWASVWTDRAVDYRAGHGIDHGRVRMAVVVQRMVDADFAGVAFTSDPVTGNRHALVIDASPGLGESVVSGLVSPEHIVVDTRRPKVVRRTAGHHGAYVRSRPGGGTERAAGPRTAGPALPAPAVRQLIRLARDVERHFGRPQDIEWAWADGKPYVLQTRPITALPERTGVAGLPGRFRQTARAMLREVLPVRPYPIDMTAWLGPLIALLDKAVEATGVACPPASRMFIEDNGVVVRVEIPVPRPTPRLLTAPVRLARAARRRDPALWRSDPLIGTMRARADELRTLDIGGCSWPELTALLKEGPRIAAPLLELRLRYFPRTLLALAVLYVSLSLLRRRRLTGALLAGVETLTADANRALEDLATAIRADAGLSEAFARRTADELCEALHTSMRETAPGFVSGFDTFLDVYGHRDTVTPLLLTQGTWRDRPDIVLGMLKSLASQDPPPPGPGPGGQAETALFQHPVLRLGPEPLRSAVRVLLRQARWFQQIRDDTRFLAMLPLPAMRQALLEMGHRLVAEGVLDTAEDVYHLRLEELDGIGTWPPAPGLAAGLRERASDRKAGRAGLARTPLVPPAPAQPIDLAHAEVLLRGAPGSAGTAEGPVRVVHGPDGFAALRNGEVLVAAYTSPAWTPLFRRAAAVVTDAGGVASHAAIVAREYGIPAVMATLDATTRLSDGQSVLVDGDHGLVLRPRR
ncbi:phosphoenolpyruvate synthase [Streptomyces sp. BR123]|uniref:PEP/pyruvate-binding domain-containing protein n=1 Tax=Streptomyces sp. BR123 TaxID=2749828 RepID=UPI0015C4DCA8|nr:PEP/pyruvate-binding domain-containing protein [Streptomyces sp. BR123]NXY97158.1 phosphoenolpyruvate synthase [Streptomyces sp. BR123]